jgi:hypothetical protein
MTKRMCREIIAATAIFLAATEGANSADNPALERPVVRPILSFSGSRSDQIKTFAPTPVTDEVKREEPDTRVFALISGKCSTLRVAGSDFACRAVAYFQNEEGRGNFTIALDDLNDQSHIITFSGDNGRRSQDNLFELPIDRMLLNSQHRPKVDGLPVPVAQMSAGVCRQLGNFAAGQVSSISCSATDKDGKKYELQFESDGSPIILRRIRRSAPTIWLDPRQ